MDIADIGKGRGASGDLFAPLFGEAWSQRPLDILSEHVKRLAATGMLNPRRLTSTEIQILAAAVMAHIVERDTDR